MLERAVNDDGAKWPIRPRTTTHDIEVSVPVSRGERVRPIEVQREIPVAHEVDRLARRRRRILQVERRGPTVEPRERSEVINRAINITLASIALLLLSPIMIVLALLVKLTSPGPVIYKQVRVGIDRRARRTLAIVDRRRQDGGGIMFTIYKFRTMCVDAECGTGAVWASTNDPRVTPIGKVLRQFRLDELPQLWNVVIGDMNIVGPRPERPGIFAKLRGDIEEYPNRQRARPGITGLAQVSQHYDTCLDDVKRKVEFDLEYLKRQGVAEDMRIMLKTVPVILFRKGAW
jgi:lipopolysaccharide/colanic/teichoic acid biosynthesis glycosyltransferase